MEAPRRSVIVEASETRIQWVCIFHPSSRYVMKLFPALAAFGTLLAAASPASNPLVAAPWQYVPVPAPAVSIIAKPLSQPRIEFAVINTPDADYLQTEFSGLPAGMGVRIDSVAIQALDSSYGGLRANLEVHWRWAQSGRDTIYPAARRMQFLKELKFAETSGSTIVGWRSTLSLDTVWACQSGRCVIAPTPRLVRNYSRMLLDCMAACLARDSSDIVNDIRARIGASGVALGLRPLQASVFPIRTAWIQTNGDEDIPTLCAKFPGNISNWISQDVFRFEVAPIAYTSASKPNIPRSLDYKTGPAWYAYNRTANPNLKILEDLDVRVVNDTLVKFGKSRYLQGSNKTRCGVGINDSLAGRDSWLVVPDSTGSAESIEQAMFLGFCQARNSAWRMTGDTVWLGNGQWPILVQELLSTSGIRKENARSMSIDGLALVGSRLELPWDASVAVRDLSGRRLARFTALAAGSHLLDLAGHRGAFVIDVRSLDGKAVRFLKGNSIAP